MKAISLDKKLNSIWSVKEILYEDNSIKRRYFYNNIRALKVTLNTPIARKLAGYSLIEKDLRNILNWLDLIDRIIPEDLRTGEKRVGTDRDNRDLVKGLFIACLSFYGKCFTECKGRKIKLEKDIIDSEFIPIHEQILEMRHNYASHAGVGIGESCNIALLLPNRKDTHVPPRIFIEINQIDLALHSDEEKAFRDIVQHVQNKVTSKIEKLQMEIFKKDIVTQPKDSWYKQARID